MALNATREDPLCFNSGKDVQVEDEVVAKDGSRRWVGYCHGRRLTCTINKSGQSDCKSAENNDVREEESYFYDNAS